MQIITSRRGSLRDRVSGLSFSPNYYTLVLKSNAFVNGLLGKGVADASASGLIEIKPEDINKNDEAKKMLDSLVKGSIFVKGEEIRVADMLKKANINDLRRWSEVHEGFAAVLKRKEAELVPAKPEKEKADKPASTRRKSSASKVEEV